ncbi:MAG: methylmalonyl-CoA mutase small subunit [Bacteroidales bacterium]|nr:methylmalonyl-CoA mutase small subunit [Bacteroidales bacterium]
MSDKKIRLFEEFPSITYEEWKQKTIADLKGADFDKKLVWKTIEGIDVQPLYTKEDVLGKDLISVLPGQFPFVRGSKKKNNDWHIRQNVVVKNAAEANKKIIDILMKGITSVGYVIDDASEWKITDMQALVKDICLDSIEHCFEIKKGKTHAMKLFVEVVKQSTYQAKKICGSVNLDCIGNLTLKGAFCTNDKGTYLESLSEMMEITKDMPCFKICSVHAGYFQNAGASAVEELAMGLSVGAQYLTDFTAKGKDASLLSKRMKFNFSVGASYFVEIAKFRAAKLLWAKIVESYQPSCNCENCDCEKTSGCGCADSGKKLCKCACVMSIHAETSAWNKTIYDPYVNMLRTQTEAMSASLGGVNSLTVLPFNAIFEKPTDFSERIARNQQILLKEECHFDKVVDPSAGSYYIESLTEMIAEKAWDLFLQIDDKGGYIEAFTQGFIQKKVAETATKKDSNIATRRDNVLGTNQFPNFNEVKEDQLDLSYLTSPSQKAANAIAEPLRIYRGAQAFELLRYKTDAYSKSKSRPKVFMLTIGSPTFRSARSQFSSNFFGCAGFEVKDNNGFATVEEGISAAQAYGANIIVLCSSDEEYAELAPVAFEKAKNTIFVVAGAPACTDELKAKGIKNFISMKSNLLETLQYYQKELGIN